MWVRIRAKVLRHGYTPVIFGGAPGVRIRPYRAITTMLALAEETSHGTMLQSGLYIGDGPSRDCSRR